MRRMMCPSCLRRGVAQRNQSAGESWFGCQYCDWFCWVDGQSSTDVKRRQGLRDLNPERAEEVPT